jgi:hypothetical protein
MPHKTFSGAAAIPTPPVDLGIHQVPAADEFTAVSTSATFNVIPAPGAGNHLRIRKAQLTNHIDDLVEVTLQESGAGPVQGLNAIMAANGGGSNVDWGNDEGWLLGDNEALFMTITSQGLVLSPHVSITILDFFIFTP